MLVGQSATVFVKIIEINSPLFINDYRQWQEIHCLEQNLIMYFLK